MDKHDLTAAITRVLDLVFNIVDNHDDAIAILECSRATLIGRKATTQAKREEKE